MGPAGESIRLVVEKAGDAAGEEKKAQIIEQLREQYKALVSDKGVWAGSSTWLITATKPL